jgi:hypothetical protein
MANDGQRNVYQVDLVTMEEFVIVENLPTTVNPRAVAYNIVTDKVYWCDISSYTVNTAYLNGSGVETLVTGARVGKYEYIYICSARPDQNMKHAHAENEVLCLVLVSSESVYRMLAHYL